MSEALKGLLEALENFEKEADRIVESIDEEKRMLRALLDQTLAELRVEEERLIQAVRERALMGAKQEAERVKAERMRQFNDQLRVMEEKLRAHKENVIKMIEGIVLP